MMSAAIRGWIRADPELGLNSSRRSTGRRRGRGVRPATRRGGQGLHSWRPWAILLGLAAALAAVMLAAVALGRNSDGTVILPAATVTPEQTADNRSSTPVPSTATASQPPAGTATPTPTLGPLLPCGDILAPLGKERSLAPDCAPVDLTPLPDRMSYFVDLPIVLRQEAADAMILMLDAAREQGFEIVVRSAYRSYADQERTYAYNVAAFGQEYADRSSARPGHSEHQLGTTGDLTSASNGFALEGFGNTAEGRWVAENAATFGFVLSYPEGAEQITGYVYEPWHVRYVGVDVAAAIVASGLTPIEYLLDR